MEKELLETKEKNLIDIAMSIPLSGEKINSKRSSYSSLNKEKYSNSSEYCTPSTDCNCDCYCNYDCNDCE